MSRWTFHCSHTDSAPSAACTETDDEDDGPAKFSSDSESEDAQPSTMSGQVRELRRRTSTRTMPSASLIVKDILATSLSAPGPLALPHSHCSIRLYQASAQQKFTPWHSQRHHIIPTFTLYLCSSIHTAPVQPDSRHHTYAAVPHSSSCQCATAFRRREWEWRNNLAAWGLGFRAEILGLGMGFRV